MSSMINGLHGGFSFAEYQRLDGINASGLKEFARSPLHYQEQLRNPLPPTPAQLFGTAIHHAMLEPSSFLANYCCQPDEFPRRAGKAYTTWRDEHPDQTVLTGQEWKSCISIVEAVERHGAARQYLQGDGITEVTAIWQERGLDCKGRLDLLKPNGIIVDVKTAIDASHDSFQRAVVSYGYDIQAAWYLRGVQTITELPATFVWIVIEKAAPHAIAVYRPSDNMLATAWERIMFLLNEFEACTREDHWYGYGEEVQELSYPDWMLRKLERGEVMSG